MTTDELELAKTGYQAARAHVRRASRARTTTTTDPERLRDARHRRQARHSYGLAQLLTEREDLRGVYAPADLVNEGMLWSA